MRTTIVTTPAATVPSHDGFQHWCDEIACLLATIDRLQAEKTARLQEIEAEYHPRLAEAEARVAELSQRAAGYCTQHRAALLPRDRKSAETVHARYGFRALPPRLVLLESDEEVAQRLLDRQMPHLVEVRHTVRKVPLRQALQSTPEHPLLVDLGTITPGAENFFVEPRARRR